jgi:ubiquinone/menaquinone biosynthesis C-methylase UbiE
MKNIVSLTLLDLLFRPFIYKKKVTEFILENNLDPILVVCSGLGRLSYHIVNEKKDCKCVGLDIDCNRIYYAHRKYPHQLFVCANANKLPFRDNLFQGIVFDYALHDKSPVLRKEIIAEVKRVILQEGKIVITDFDTPYNLKTKCSHLLTFIKELLSNHFHIGMNFVKKGGLSTLLHENALYEVNRQNHFLLSATTILVKKARKLF